MHAVLFVMSEQGGVLLWITRRQFCTLEHKPDARARRNEGIGSNDSTRVARFIIARKVSNGNGLESENARQAGCGRGGFVTLFILFSAGVASGTTLSFFDNEGGRSLSGNRSRCATGHRVRRVE